MKVSWILGHYIFKLVLIHDFILFAAQVKNIHVVIQVSVLTPQWMIAAIKVVGLMKTSSTLIQWIRIKYQKRIHL
jgi:hypothetical protein